MSKYKIYQAKMVNENGQPIELDNLEYTARDYIYDDFNHALEDRIKLCKIYPDSYFSIKPY